MTTSRQAGSNVPLGHQILGGQLSPRAPLNLQFHTENIMSFLKSQKAALEKLIHPQGTEAALNKAS